MEVTNFIGETGKYQNVILVLAMYRGVMLAVNNLCASFMFPDVGHWCARLPYYANWSLEEWKDEAIPQKSSGEYHTCLRYAVSKHGINRSAGVFCNAWEYDHSEFWPSGTEKVSPGSNHYVGFVIVGRISDMYIEESPKWLLTVGKYARAEEAIRKIAKINGRPEMKEEEFAALKCYYREQRSSQEEISGSGLKVLCKSKKMILFTVTNVFFQLCTAIVRYELALDTQMLPVDPYTNFVIGGVVEVTSGIASYAILLYLPRKRSTICFLLLTTAAYVVHACVPKEYIAAETLTMLVGRLCIGNVININIIYLSEMFPTGARALAIGFAQTVFGVGAAVQPLIKHPFGNPTADAVFYAVTMLLATAAVLAWPETKDRPLPDFVANIEAAGSSQSSSRSLDSTGHIELASFQAPTHAIDVSSAVQRAGAVAAAVASPAGAGVVAAGQSETSL
ncbi:hypothetical protein V5799_005079 [Amblyomma americanum]|uniref:Uncharacterized protein n=1 Tax=Amblyomma americanum TaxID=6943 RepID=A0AAQ4E0A1_AMBAM